MNGAVAVLCDACLLTHAEPKFVCRAGAAEPGRVPIEELPSEPFGHDLTKHPEAMEVSQCLN